MTTVRVEHGPRDLLLIPEGIKYVCLCGAVLLGAEEVLRHHPRWRAEDAPSADPYLVFDATLAQSIESPCKPTRDTSTVATEDGLTKLRRWRVQLDAYLTPGNGEKLQLTEEETIEVRVYRLGRKIPPRTHA